MRDASPPRCRSCGRDAALDVQEVLQRDRQAVQRASRHAGFAFEVGCVGASERFLAINLDKGMEPRIERIDARQTRFGDVSRRYLAAIEASRKLGQRNERQVVVHGGAIAAAAIIADHFRSRSSHPLAGSVQPSPLQSKPLEQRTHQQKHCHSEAPFGRRGICC